MEGTKMREFHIVLRSLQQVQAFVDLAMMQPFDVYVGNDRQNINGKDLMGMFGLDLSEPVSVRMRCSLEEYDSFSAAACAIA